MPQWPVPAENAIRVGGLPLFHEYEADATIYPGMLVILVAGSQGHCTPCTPDDCNVVGVADLAMASQTGRGSWRHDHATYGYGKDDAKPYTTGDQVKVISGDIFVELIVCPLQNIAIGDKLSCCATGYVHDYDCSTTADPCAIVAEAMETVVTGVAEYKYVLAKLLI